MDETEFARELDTANARLEAAAAKTRAGAFHANHVEGIRDAALALPIPAQRVTGDVASVDGGVAAVELHGASLVVARSAGVCCSYENGELRRARYWPTKAPPANLRGAHGLEANELAWFKNLTRLESELTAALACVKHFRPNALLLDGGLAPHPADKPGADSQLAEAYGAVVKQFQSLYAACEKNNVLLAGVAKDSRSRAAVEFLRQASPAFLASAREGGNWTDSLFFSFALRAGERSFAFRVTGAKEINPVMRDLGEWADALQAFYVRPSERDRPLRVDFLNPGAEARGGGKTAEREGTERAAGLVNALAGINARYAYPAVLIEADLRAALRPEYVDAVVSRVLAQTKPGNALLAGLRRNSRPFR